MEKFFLSYSRADQAFALRLAADLRGAGSPLWVDQFDISPSERWDRAVENAVRECAGLLVVLSPRAVASENVLDEVTVALDSGKRVIPVLYERCVLPLRLARVQFIDATADYAAALERCRMALDTGGPPAAPASAPDAGSPERLFELLAPEVIERAATALAGFLGPAAPVLVAKAAAQAANTVELYVMLAASLSDPADRVAFLRQAHASPQARVEAAAPIPAPPAAQPAGLDLPDLDKVAAVLTHYIGPLARHVVLREQRQAHDRDELFQRLGTRVPNARERSELMGRLRAL